MIERHDEIVAALKQARDLVVARGYQLESGSINAGGPININNALHRACDDDYDLYLRVRQCFSQNWGGPLKGLAFWETGQRHTLSEVIDLFGAVLTRVEKNEARPTGLPRLSGTRSRASR